MDDFQQTLVECIGPDGRLLVAWDSRLIVLSVAVAILGSFAALDCAERMRVATAPTSHRRYFLAGAVLMGLAIWTMHFVGMLALRMPLRVHYDPGLSLLSVIAAAVGAAIAFRIVDRPTLKKFQITMGGIAMGVAIVAMHYIGMASMRMGAAIRYDPFLFNLSVVIAIGTSAAALALAYLVPKADRLALVAKGGSAIVMGAAISGMHYVGMAAASYIPVAAAADAPAAPVIGNLALSDALLGAGIVFLAALLALSSQAAAERRRLADSYRGLAEELERRVHARTAELEAANRELAAFSYSVSHDLRAPLRGIMGFSKQLARSQSERLDQLGRQQLARIDSAVLRMSELIDGLLQLARVSRASLVDQPVNLSELGARIAEEFAAGDPERKVEWHIAEGLMTRGDPALLSSVLQNLLGNAWKFTARAAPARIELATTAAGRDGHQVFYVRDNGVGFSMNHTTKLFGVFERLHHVSDFPGTGIGLATSKRIIERHGGSIWAEAEVDRGATFFFTLPHPPTDMTS